MADVIPFDFNGNQVRTFIGEDGEPWFIAKDVAQILGYGQTNSMNKVVDDEDKSKVTLQFGGNYRNQSLINESGVYQAIFSSTLPNAKTFKRWVTSEVLPQIRRTGSYSLSEVPQEWLKARAEGKIVRKEETDVIKAFVVYAEAQGSKNARMYYQNITLGTYRALFLLEQGGQWKDLRSYLSPLQLNQLGVAEHVAMKHIKEGMELGMHYKDVYAYAIGKVKEMAVLLGKQVPHSSGSVEKLK